MDAEPDLAILVMAAGSGERAGPGVPKQYRPVLGVSLLRLTLNCLGSALPHATIRTVIAAHHHAAYLHASDGLDVGEPVIGGATRQESVLRGLEALEPQAPGIVLIHDAARPFVSAGTITRLLDRLSAADVEGVSPGLAILDSVKRCDASGLVLDGMDRNGLWRVQTPQAFRFQAILKAHRATPPDGSVTDDLAVAQAQGLAVALVSGDEACFKVTTSEDFARAEAHLLSILPDVRVGTGFDVHGFGDGDCIMLCGVAVPHTHGLVGHSDADVGMHALTDAILGAIGAGDIGSHFPPSDPQWRGVDSAKFLTHAAGLVAARGGVIAHADITIVCEAPKVGPHRAAMVARLVDILGIPGRVSVKATTTERLGFTGRREGIAAQAAVTVRLPR